MSDVVVTVPTRAWAEWLAEGGLPGEDVPETTAYLFSVKARPRIEPGERVYVVANGRLRGYAPLVEVAPFTEPYRGWNLVRQGGAVAVTLMDAGPDVRHRQVVQIRGFQGFRYRWWPRGNEAPYPAWREL